MPPVALAIRLDSKGPILAKQRRYGFDNELIEVLKFRSMYTDMPDSQMSLVGPCPRATEAKADADLERTISAAGE